MQAMEQVIDYLQEHPWVYRLAASIAVIPLTYVLRVMAMRWVKKSPIKSADLRRRWMGTVQQLSVVLAVLIVFLIWASQIQALALSLVAVAAAVVIATKELLLCLLGGMLKASCGMYTLGDRIEINSMRGQVIDQGLLTTRLMEVGPGKLVQQYTGRVLVMPNAWLLSHTLINETDTSDYDLHAFIVPIKAEDDWRQHERWLLDAAEQACKPHLEDARKSIDRYAEKRFMDKITVNPRVIPSIPEPDRIDLVVRIPVPTGMEGRLQRMIIRKYLQSRQAPGSVEPANASGAGHES